MGFQFLQDDQHATNLITLTPENAQSIAKLAALIEWTPDELVNRLLTETFEEFADGFSGSLEGFLARFITRIAQAHNGRWTGLRK